MKIIGNENLNIKVSLGFKRLIEDEAAALKIKVSPYLREIVANRNEDHISIQRDLERLDEENTALKVANKRLQMLSDKHSDGDSQIKQDYELRIADLKSQLQRQSEVISDEDLEKVKQDYDQTIDGLNQQIEKLESKIDTTAETVGAAYNEKIDLLTEQLEELQVEVKEDDLLIENLRLQLANPQTSKEDELLINVLTSKQEAMQEELDDSVEKLIISEEKLEKLDRLVKTYKEEIEKFTEDYHQLEEQSGNQQTKIEKSRGENIKLEFDCERLRGESAEIREEVERLRREDLLNKAEIRRLNEFSDREEVLELRETVATLEKDKKKLSEDRLFYIKKRTQVIRLNDTLEEEKENLEERIEDLKTELLNAKWKRGTDAENEERKILVEQLTTDTERYQQECEEKDSTIGDLVEQIEEHQSTIQMLQSQLENLEEDDDYDEEEEEEYGEVATDDEDIEYQDEVEEEDDYIAYTEVIPVPSVTEFTEAENELYSELITELHVRYPHETIERLILGCLEANRANEGGVFWTKTVAGGLKLLNSKV